MANATNRRRAKRVEFDYEAVVMAVDGTWSRKAKLSDISDSGAKLRVYGAVPERLNTEEFFLVMTPDGAVKRRAKVVWARKAYLGVGFIASHPDSLEQ